MPTEIELLIKKLSPFMESSSEIFKELSIFFGSNAKIDVHIGDLSKFLGHKRLYRVIKLKGNSYKECVYDLVDNHPESMQALGMLRYYKAPNGRINWQDVESAEIAMGQELTTNAYGWSPDAWTLFENFSNENIYEMVAILAYSFDD